MSATSYLARNPSRYCVIADIAKRQGLPVSFLAKILRHLARRNVTTVHRGPGGGHTLARSPARISLAEIIEAVELPSAGERPCPLELHGCGAEAPCALHEKVCRAERQLWQSLAETTLDDYVKGLK